MAKNFLLTRRDTVKRITMALIETTHFLKTRKEESKKLIGKYAQQYNSQFLEASYNAMVKLHDRVPLVTRERRRSSAQRSVKAQAARHGQA
jgi:phosphoenolpyruvate carboxylase